MFEVRFSTGEKRESVRYFRACSSRAASPEDFSRKQWRTSPLPLTAMRNCAACGDSLTGGAEFQLRNCGGAERLEFRRKADHGRRDFRGGFDADCRRLRPEQGGARSECADARRGGRQFLEGRLRELDKTARAGSSAWRATFRQGVAAWWRRAPDLPLRPSAEERGLLRRSGRSGDAPRRRQEGDGRRVDNLKEDKSRGRAAPASHRQIRAMRQLPAARRFPCKDQVQVGCRCRGMLISRRRRGERDGSDSVLERQVGDFDDELVWRRRDRP